MVTFRAIEKMSNSDAKAGSAVIHGRIVPIDC